MARFVIRQTATGFRFDLRAGNGESIATSEVYDSKAACIKGIQSVKANCAAGIEDQTAGTVMGIKNPKFEVYEDRAGQFRFRLKAKNGKIVAVSEGYTTKAGCENGIASIRENAPDATVEDA